MNKIINYILDSFNELVNRVTWPSLKELQESSLLILVSSFIIAMIVYIMDASSGQFVKIIYAF